jgi:hypothetical protein
VQIPNYIAIIVALILSLSISFLQYFYKEKYAVKNTVLLFCLRSFSIFLLLLLLFNPTINKVELQTIKPVLSVLVDNSQSILFLKENKNIVSCIQSIKNDPEIEKRFDVIEFSFGNKLNKIDSLSFTDTQTNISEAISSQNQLYSNRIAPIILLTDGNQTIGTAFEFTDSNQKIFPVVFGDTIQYTDLKIEQLNVNKFSYLKNKFPVEVLLNYQGKKRISSQFSIYNNGTSLFSKKIQFSPTNNSKTILTNLTSNKKGLQYYTASIKEIKGEKNIKNNTKKFSVEVIDEQTKVLILTSVLHPDLGSLKKSIESNQQRSVDIFSIDKFKKEINDYQLVILYQLNKKFNNIIKEVKLKNKNYLLISGTNTNWDFINNQQLNITKNHLNSIENYEAIFNNSYLSFAQKDIGFNQFPPLKDKFGEIAISKEHQTLLYQQINGIKSNQPLLVTFDENSHKSGVLFGEGIWKWRATSFLSENSFYNFDQFIGDLVQYLASNKKRNRLDSNIEALYSTNSNINISAFYRDKNYKFDTRASLEITVTNTDTKKTLTSPFRLINDSYQTILENLNSGVYNYKIAVLDQPLNIKGQFTIKKEQIEQQFTNANFNKLFKIADRTGGELYFKNEVTKLKKALLNDKSFYTTQEKKIVAKQLIDWKWILVLIISSFTLEWFLRKYLGKI